MKRLIVLVVMVVVAIELGCLAFDSLQRSMETDMAALHESRAERMNNGH